MLLDQRFQALKREARAATDMADFAYRCALASDVFPAAEKGGSIGKWFMLTANAKVLVARDDDTLHCRKFV